MRSLRILGFATLALALPSPAVQENSAAIVKRGVEDSVAVEGLYKRGPIDQAFSSAAADLSSSVNPKITVIQSSVATLKSSTDAQVTAQAVATIRTNLQGIAVDLGRDGIVIVGAVSSLGRAVPALTQADIDNLTAALNSLTSTLTNIQATLVLVQSVSASTTAAVASNIFTVRLSATTIVNPVQILVPNIIASGTIKGLNVTNLTEAYRKFDVIGVELISGL
ncbi:hypothetical protein JX265_002246 [Neoarthrinium moseri]|uniref:Uncharacterized protein n=1 Tax=Neoarthrinium moseri TaxID=1658444 RepID=A0A9P9WTY3_9PEZI|nr:uncharacterized protein JN550_007554 [Neoarthrinium moseri]KAI1850348.1 hypothetical protein JX266_004206 [Neoarthrinium moseri]KAI1866701.1 hypothetical protein JN550_007554 [Neoarthrinium moseri]KAI1879292.1 hypothetical protein JX265_002246 [Neoarthrinium moseri]